MRPGGAPPRSARERRVRRLLVAAGGYSAFGVGMLSLLAGSTLALAGIGALVMEVVYLAGVSYFRWTARGRRRWALISGPIAGARFGVTGARSPWREPRPEPGRIYQDPGS